MSDTTETAASEAPRKRGGGLSGMLVADLRAMADAIGISGAGTMKKPQLVAAIRAAGTPSGESRGAEPAREEPAREKPAREKPAREKPAPEQPDQEQPVQDQPRQDRPERDPQDQGTQERGPQEKARRRDQGKQDQGKQDQGKQDQGKQDQGKQDQGKQDGPSQDQPRQDQPRQDEQQDGEGEGRRNRRRRGRDRNRGETAGAPQGGQQGQGGQGTQGGQGGPQQGGQGGQGQGGQQHGGQQRHQREPDTTILEDDVLVPAAGILDVLDNYAFVRTSGYLPGPDDVYVSLSMVRKYGLRRGDALMGQVRQPREGERKEKFNPMVRIDLVNGADPEGAKDRPDLADLVAVHPSRRLRLAAGPDDVTGRVLDLVAPLGKGQRALVVSPPRAGKTGTIAALAQSLTVANPECHLMVVLVDQRPEEVTDFTQGVKGEVIASTFDRPAGDHVVLAELAVERAKRLVELGHDVVVLVDGLTRLARAYASAPQPTGRGSSSTPPAGPAEALHLVKRFLGAARDVEDGGSLTVVATVQRDSGLEADAVLLEELEGVATSVVRLSREAARAGLHPAVDPTESATAHVDRLLDAEEAPLARRLQRAVAAAASPQAALEQLLDRVRRTRTNTELLSRLPDA